MFRIYSGDELIYEPGDQELVVFDPKLTLEMGKAGSLEFTVPTGHYFLPRIHQISTPVSVDLDGEEIFRGRVLSGTRTFYNNKEVYCEGELSYLVDSVQKAEKYNGKTHALFQKIIQNHNARMPAEKQFTVGNITVEDRDIKLTGQEEVNTGNIDYKQIAINSVVDDWNTTYDCIENWLISYCGGYLMTRKENGVVYIDWVEDYTDTSTQEIEFAENLLDLTEELSADDLFTVLVPIGDDNLTIKSVNNNSDELVDEAAVAQYGRIIKTHVFSNVNQASTLKENGQHYLQLNAASPQTLTLKAVDMHNIDPDIRPIHLGDRVYIRSDPHELSKYLTCSKIEYDLQNPANTVYTFGREKQTLTQRYREDKRKQSDTYTSGEGIGAAAGAYGAGAAAAIDEAAEQTRLQFEVFSEKLKTKIGIDLDAEEGTLDLYAMIEQITKFGQVMTNNLGINLDAPAGTINIFSTAQLANSLDTKTAEIIAWAGVDSQGNLGSRIALNADVIEIQNELTAIRAVVDNLEVKTAYGSSGISASSFYSSNYRVSSGTDAGEWNLAQHYHHLSLVNGKLSIGVSGPTNNSVDVAVSSTPVFGA